MSLQLGDVPAWISALAESSAVGVTLWQVTRKAREAWAITWASLVEELAQLTPTEIRSAVDATPAIAEILGSAWETAARSANEDKRRLLARVAAAALRGDEGVRPDELLFFLRTLEDLEPAHVRLLVVIAESANESHDGDSHGVTTPDLEQHWPEAGEFLLPILLSLEGAGVIENIAAGTYDGLEGTKRWRLSLYGHRFLTFLLPDGQWDLPSPVREGSASADDQRAPGAPPGMEQETRILRAVVDAEDRGDDPNEAARSSVTLDAEVYKATIVRLKQAGYLDVEILKGGGGKVMAMHVKGSFPKALEAIGRWSPDTQR